MSLPLRIVSGGLSLRISVGLWSFLLLLAMAVPGTAMPLRWPTPNPAWLQGEPPEAYLQPTASGRLESALFGCVRNGGRRFHEGIDLKAIEHDRQRESTDPVFSVLPGVVVYINRVAGHSSYGIYVVIEHPDQQPALHTVYAHLRSVRSDLRPGQRVAAGEQIGVLGRTAGGYTIPRSRAHLHFEMGFRLTDDFQRWFDRQGFGSPNRHGRFNGMNMLGFDPLDFYEQYRSGEVSSFRSYLQNRPVAYTLRITTTRIPDFIRRYPTLLARPLPASGVQGWEIGFTWYGLPVRWYPLGARQGRREGLLELLMVDEDLLRANACRQTVVWERGDAVIGPQTRRIMALLFGYE